MPSLRKLLLDEINSTPDKIAGGTLEARGWEWGYKPSTVSRRLRELAKEGTIIATYDRYVSYQRCEEEGTTVAPTNRILPPTIQESNRGKDYSTTIQMGLKFL